MKTSLTYGFIMALCCSLVSLGFFFTGFHDTAEKMQLSQNLGLLLNTIIAIVCIVLGTREKRSLAPADKDWGYSSALGTGVMIGLVGAVLASIYTYAYFAAINPSISDIILQIQLDKLEAQGKSADEIARAEPMMRKMMGPAVITVMSFLMIFVFNVVIALITSAFLKNRPAAQPPVAA